MNATPTRICVLTSCTGSKVATAQRVPAENLYCGQHHVRLMRGVGEARHTGLDVDVSVVSASYGIVRGSDRLLPYEQTFQGKPAGARRELARKLEIPQAARRALTRPADLHLVLLGEDYLDACELGDDVSPSAPVLVVCAAGTALRLPPIRDVHTVALTTEDTRRFHCGLVALKGEIGGRLLAYIADTSPSVADLTSSELLDNLTTVRLQANAVVSTLF